MRNAHSFSRFHGKFAALFNTDMCSQCHSVTKRKGIRQLFVRGRVF